MSKDKLLLETGCEEMPAPLLPGVIRQMEKEAAAILENNRLSYSLIKAYATPRRLVLLVEGLAVRQADIREQVKGPARSRAFDENGQPTRAALGFAQSMGVEVEDLRIEEMKGTEYVIAVRETPGKDTGDLLPELLPGLLSSLRFPHSMYWYRKDVKFIRPVRWLLCLWGDEVVSFHYAGVDSGGYTYGHRFLAPGPWAVKSVGDFFDYLEQSFVVLDQEKRKELIREQLESVARETGGVPWVEDELLEEVTFLVEYPEVIRGNFPERYLDLPREVLITTMQVHQRYFPVVSSPENGELLPAFLGVSNNRSNSYIRKGYEKVLQARLADADFFYREDRKKPLEEYVPGLREVVFQEGLGNLYEKTERIVTLVRAMADYWKVDRQTLELSARTAYLCKADLLTNMVQEFPELQGVMGREYAVDSGEDSRVASGIHEHYLPRFSGDTLPETTEGVLVSLGDRIDTLCGFFYAGIQPTGSQDPYALRRQAIGVVSILVEKELPLPIRDILQEALALYMQEEEQPPEEKEGRKEEIMELLKEFIDQRIRFLFQEKRIRYDVIEAVLAVPCSYISSLYKKASSLEEGLKSGGLENLLAGYTRVNNLARKVETPGEIDPSLFQESAEENLWRKTEQVETEVNRLIQKEDYDGVLQQLAETRDTIDSFFDEVMVMVEEEELRQNRLNLLAELKRVFNVFAEFSLLQSSI